MAPLDPTLQAAALALVHFLWQGALVALVAFAALRVARTPNARYLIGIAALAVMLVAPIGTAWWIGARLNGASLTSATSEPVSTGAAVVPDETRVTPPVQSAASPASDSDRLAWSSTSTEAAVLMVWACGVLLLSTRLAGGWIVARRLAHRSIVPARPEIAVLARRMAGRLALDRAVHVFESSAVAVPIMVGWLKPVVLLPVAALGGLSPTQLEALIAHELAHVRRHDYLVNLLQSAVETILFYHPAVWWMSRQVRAEREHCCDDLAVTVCDRLVYVSALADLAALSTLAPRPLALAASDGSLLARVRRLLGGPRDPRPSSSLWTLAIAAVVLAIGGSQMGPWSTRRVDAAALRQDPVARPVAVAFGRPQTAPVAPTPQTTAAAPVVESSASPAALAQVADTQEAAAVREKLTAALARLANQARDLDSKELADRFAALQKAMLDADQAHAKLASNARLAQNEVQTRQADEVAALVARVKALLAQRKIETEAVARKASEATMADVAATKLMAEKNAALAEVQAKRGTTSISQSTDDSSGTYSWSQDGQRVVVKWNGPFKLSDDDKDIAWVQPGKTVEVTDGSSLFVTGVTRTAHADGTIDRAYRHNGMNGPFDPEGKAFLADALGRLIAHTGFAADVRVARLMRSGGVDAVLTFVDTLDNDPARHAYYVELIHQANLSPAELARIGQRAAETMTSPYDLAEVVVSGAKGSGGNDAALLAFASAAGKINGDYDRHRALSAVLPDHPSPALAASVLKSSAGLRSDYDRSEILSEALRKHALTAETKPLFAAAADGIRSEYERDRLQKALAATAGAPDIGLASRPARGEAVDALLTEVKTGALTDGSASDFFGRVADLPSMLDRARVMSAVVERGFSSDGIVTAYLKTSVVLSDRERASALIDVLKGRTLTPAQRKLYLMSAEGIRSSAEQDRALAALVRAEGGRS